MAKEGPTEEELAKAKTYLKGSFALGLDTSTKIAEPARADAARQSRHRLHRAPLGADRRRHAGRHQAGGQAPARSAACWSRSSAVRRASPRTKLPRGWLRRLGMTCTNLAFPLLAEGSDAFTSQSIDHARARTHRRRTAWPRRPSTTRSARTGDALAWLRARHADGSLPLLRLPAKTRRSRRHPRGRRAA